LHSGTGGIDWRSRGHFFAVAARLMRQILVDHARKRATFNRNGGNLIFFGGLTAEGVVTHSREGLEIFPSLAPK